ncbi:hypothetical protein HDR63_00950 [bacterium]|nr:hypothetical protein [bacterium]
MQKPKTIDATTGRVGCALRVARTANHMSAEEASRLLYIMPDELIQYERGLVKIPQDILEHLLMMGYRMIHFLTLEKRYRFQRRIYHKIKDIVTEVP